MISEARRKEIREAWIDQPLEAKMFVGERAVEVHKAARAIILELLDSIDATESRILELEAAVLVGDPHQPALTWRDAYRAATLARDHRIQELEAHIGRLRFFVDRQAEDEGLWFRATTAPEAYLQKALRDLHTVIESIPNRYAKS